MKQKMAIGAPAFTKAGPVAKAMARFLARMKERQLFDLWQSSKTKKEDTIGKRAELELRRKVEGNDYHHKESKKKDREFAKMAEKFRKFIMGLTPMAEGPKRSEAEVGAT